MSALGLYGWTSEAAQSQDQKVVERCECQECENLWFAKWRSTVHPDTTKEKTLAAALTLLPFGHIYSLSQLVLDYYDADSWLTMSILSGPKGGRKPFFMHYDSPDTTYSDFAVLKVTIPKGKQNSYSQLLINKNALFRLQDIGLLNEFLGHPNYSEDLTTYEVTSKCTHYKLIAELYPKKGPVTLTSQCRLSSDTRIIALIKKQILAQNQ